MGITTSQTITYCLSLSLSLFSRAILIIDRTFLIKWYIRLRVQWYIYLPKYIWDVKRLGGYKMRFGPLAHWPFGAGYSDSDMMKLYVM